ncbi:MAG TPA: class I SAM-dependent methyltransferase [Ramlibacter sp.]|uniref:class I SAM-dependent methyltransferase n=1 Tax=Ramlibacter sp. TaxID=1917967 RepID=UPI002CA4BDB3|nr:class I SAM-dependent methyltransferase [Ramlibacter sp.]HVZ42366.1 class I SAM-dependent methyltransferase [Ramlibacter sp.]
MTIEAHSRIAQFYRFRPPYKASFFDAAAQKLGLTPETVLLDLCCGRGELASGFSRLCKSIVAVDGSERMLEHRIERPNVSYLRHDLNGEPLALAERADHFVIGSAVQWLKPPKLRELVDDHLKPGGAILVTHTLFRMDGQPYARALAEFNEGFSRRPGQGFQGLGGAERMEALGFREIDRLRLTASVSFDVDYLFRNQLSYLYEDAFEQVTADMERYRTEMHKALARFCNAEGKLAATLVNWGVIYSRAA